MIISRYLIVIFWVAVSALACAKQEAVLADNVASTVRRLLSDVNAPRLVFDDKREAHAWLSEMSGRLARRIPDKWTRERLLIAIHYEANRAGLDPQLVLSLIQVESGFNKYAVSSAGARGLMQVMPFWVRSIGNAQHNLFDLTTNLRYGCTILRYYLDLERGNLFRALGRYNGSLGRPEYPKSVVSALENRWHWVSPYLAASSDAMLGLTRRVIQR